MSSLSLLAEIARERRAALPGKQGGALVSRWHPVAAYVNRETGKTYQPHHDREIAFVNQDGPWRYGLAKGGEGGGKSVAGIIKTLERLRRGMSGAMVSPDLEHFKKSLWPEFQRWCPWGEVVESQRRRASMEWIPSTSFALVFKNGTRLYCGGIDDPESWEGPNLHFAHGDEARRKKDAGILKVLDGRVRMVGPNGEMPQLYFTTTPRKHWLFDYFGPLKADDEFASFKSKSFVIDLVTAGNAANLAPGFVEDRRRSLTEAEARVLLEAAWEDIDDAERFLPSMTWWDACQEVLAALGNREALVLAADAGVSNDYFALVGVTRHPQRRDHVAVRYVRQWTPPSGGKINFDEIEAEIERLCKAFYVVQLTYDPYQLHQMMSRLQGKGIAWCSEFGQQTERLEADKRLYDLITSKQLVHDGNEALRACADNANAKRDADRKLRIVKRTQAGKIDALVALSMASHRCLNLNL